MHINKSKVDLAKKSIDGSTSVLFLTIKSVNMFGESDNVRFLLEFSLREILRIHILEYFSVSEKCLEMNLASPYIVFEILFKRIE